MNKIKYWWDVIERRLNVRWRRFLWTFGIVTDREVWDLDIEIARFIAPRIARLVRVAHGYSPEVATDPAAYRARLGAIAEAFAVYARIQDGTADHDDEYALEKSLDLIQKEFPILFPSLWD